MNDGIGEMRSASSFKSTKKNVDRFDKLSEKFIFTIKRTNLCKKKKTAQKFNQMFRASVRSQMETNANGHQLEKALTST